MLKLPISFDCLAASILLVSQMFSLLLSTKNGAPFRMADQMWQEFRSDKVEEERCRFRPRSLYSRKLARGRGGGGPAARPNPKQIARARWGFSTGGKRCQDCESWVARWQQENHILCSNSGIIPRELTIYIMEDND